MIKVSWPAHVFFDPQNHVPVGEALLFKFSTFLSLPCHCHEFYAKSARLSRYGCRSSVGTYEGNRVAPSPMFTMSLYSLLLLPIVIAGQHINHTIDDTLGDELTGLQVNYSPAGQHSNGSMLAWKNASQCSDCAIVPDRSLAMNGTWTGATYYPSLENVTAQLRFHGTIPWV